MWRATFIALIVGLAIITTIAVRRRNSAWLKVASILWSLSGAFVMLAVLLATETSFGSSRESVGSEAILLLSLGGAMVIGGIVLYTSRRPRQSTPKD